MDDNSPIYYMLSDKAQECMGIYPMAMVKDGVETPRTEWQDGWNAAVKAHTEKHIALCRWFDSIPVESQSIASELLFKDILFLGTYDDKVALCINVNDTFMYACGDAEEVPMEHIPFCKLAHDTHGWYGLAAYAAYRRNMEPIKEIYQTDAYIEAFSWVKDMFPVSTGERP